MEEYQYDRLTWEEMNEAISADKVVILPTGTTEQHGPHLPLDVDRFLVQAVCMEAGRRAPLEMLVLPTIPFGLNLHHIDFPGTIHVEPEVFVAYCLSVTKSVAYHGFRHILVVNGHGSNAHLVDLVARKTVLETHSVCAAVSYFTLAWNEYDEIRDTDTLAHADEFETSLYLHLAKERVRMDRAVKGQDRRGAYVSSDSTREFHVRFSDYWGRWTTTGVHGDPTSATAEKGKRIFETAVEELISLVREWRSWPVADRADMHTNPVQDDIRW